MLRQLINALTKQLIKELEAAEWHSSKRGAPHEYVLSTVYPELVAVMQKRIKAEGKYERINGFRQRYLRFAGYIYWVMPGISALPACWVLNRVKQ